MRPWQNHEDASGNRRRHHSGQPRKPL